MRRYKANSKDLVSVQRVSANPVRYFVAVCQAPYTPSPAEVRALSAAGSPVPDMTYMNMRVKGSPTPDNIRRHLSALQREWDTSDEVNVFYHEGARCWFDVGKRNAIYRSCELAEADGKDEYTLWVNLKPVMMKTSAIKDFLSRLERYAIACNDVTNTHLTQIGGLRSMDELLSFDITNGYPAPIELGGEAQV